LYVDLRQPSRSERGAELLPLNLLLSHERDEPRIGSHVVQEWFALEQRIAGEPALGHLAQPLPRRP